MDGELLGLALEPVRQRGVGGVERHVVACGEGLAMAKRRR